MLQGGDRVPHMYPPYVPQHKAITLELQPFRALGHPKSDTPSVSAIPWLSLDNEQAPPCDALVAARSCPRWKRKRPSTS
jgi:hypothetical protein